MLTVTRRFDKDVQHQVLDSPASKIEYMKSFGYFLRNVGGWGALISLGFVSGFAKNHDDGSAKKALVVVGVLFVVFLIGLAAISAANQSRRD